MIKNTFTMNKAMLAEYMKKGPLARPRLLAYVFYALALLNVGFVVVTKTGLYESTLSAKGLSLFLSLGLAFTLLGIVNLLMHKISAAVVIRRVGKINGGMPDVVTAFGDLIVQEEGSSRLDYKYEDITHVVWGKKGIYLLMSRYFGLMLGKEGFEGTTPDAFLDFIRDKCPAAIVKGK